jgi:membrane associated rhomboid family serine protease
MFSHLTPTVRALLIANLGVWAAQLALGPDRFLPLALWPLHSDLADGGLPFEPWQLVSYAFLHIEFWHLFANMFALYMFGPDIERLLGSARFGWYYLTCGGAVMQTACW